MYTSLSRLLLAVSVCGITAVGPASAQSTSNERASNGIQRIETARGLRALSQQIPASACHIGADIATDVSTAKLTSALAEFKGGLDALEFGNATLGMPDAEDRRLTLDAVQKTREALMSLGAASANMLSGDGSDADEQAIYAQTPVVLAAVEHLVVEVVGQYANPTEMVKADSFLLDIAGRQAMLIAQMSKDSCLVVTEQNSPETTAEMQTAMSVFDASLDALRNGLPSAGLRPPPTPAISDGLGDVWNEWTALKPVLESISSGSATDSDAIMERYQSMNDMTATMNGVVEMYLTALK